MKYDLNLDNYNSCGSGTGNLVFGWEKEGIRALEEIISFTSSPEIIVVNPGIVQIKTEQRKKIYRAIKKRLGKVGVKEMNTKLEGGLIIFDKVIFFPPGKKKGFLFL